jgi:hypothetical protein
MLAHAARNSASGGCGVSHVAAVAHVPPATELIWPHIVGADNDAILFGYERFFVMPHPIGQCSVSLMSGSSAYVVPSRMIGIMIAAIAGASVALAFLTCMPKVRGQRSLVTVGTAVASRPPHGSRHALLTHRAYMRTRLSRGFSDLDSSWLRI